MRSGFSLLELSIVLVIIGLLAGGVMTGQALIHAAELRSYITQQQRILVAFNAFRDKYNAMPGDMKNATAFWTVSYFCPGTAVLYAPDGTCNGNGNGKIEYFGVTTSFEHFRAWQHLALAGMMEGTYVGVPGSTSDDRYAISNNSPITRNPGILIVVASYGQLSGSAYWWDGNYDNQLSFAAATGAAYGAPVFSTEDAWNIDTKLDDGRPGLGKMRTFRKAAHADCSTTDVAGTSLYKLDSTGIQCILMNTFLN